VYFIGLKAFIGKTIILNDSIVVSKKKLLDNDKPGLKIQKKGCS
jgi:hypothetical protein